MITVIAGFCLTNAAFFVCLPVDVIRASRTVAVVSRANSNTLVGHTAQPSKANKHLLSEHKNCRNLPRGRWAAGADSCSPSSCPSRPWARSTPMSSRWPRSAWRPASASTTRPSSPTCTVPPPETRLTTLTERSGPCLPRRGGGWWPSPIRPRLFGGDRFPCESVSLYQPFYPTRDMGSSHTRLPPIWPPVTPS